MNDQLSANELASIKRSYYNILALFLSNESVESKFVACILKWGLQLNLSKDDVQEIEKNLEGVKFKMPLANIDKMEAIYHLIRMIYLDRIVEDVELEVATLYAERLGFKRYLVGELFKSIATAPFDGNFHNKVRDEVKEFMELNNIK